MLIKLSNLVYRNEVLIDENGLRTMETCSITLMNMKSIINQQPAITKC